jgi:FrmR/RcnR family transcriptional regulator, repressor of frmRAB operon
MKFWIGPLGGALIAGAYGMLRLGEQWNTGDERAFQASGTLLAYMLLGAVIGSIISALLFSSAQNEVSGLASLPEETKPPTNQMLLQGRSLKLLDAASDTRRRCQVSHILPDRTKVQRIRPQIDALQRALDAELGFADLLQVLSDTRSAINDVSAELVGDYIRKHVHTPHNGATDEAQAVQELVDAMRSYLK